MRLPQWFSGKEFTCNAGVGGGTDSIFGSGKSPGRGNGNPLQYFCLKNLMDRVQATVPVVANSWTQLNDEAYVCARARTHTA